MSAVFSFSIEQPTMATLQCGFLQIMPRIQLHCRIFFRPWKCWQQREEFTAEALALAWLWYRRLRQKGKDPAGYPAVLATLAVRAVNNGRRLCGMEGAKDALSPRAQRLHGFVAGTLSSCSLNANPWDGALQDNRRSPIPDQVSFRLDFPAWRKTYNRRNRRLIDTLMTGETTGEVARRFRLTPARISQLRAQFKADWERFIADQAENKPTPCAT